MQRMLGASRGAQALRLAAPLRRPAASLGRLCRCATQAARAGAVGVPPAAAAAPASLVPAVELRPYQADNVAAILAALDAPGRPGAASFGATRTAPGACGAAGFPAPPRLLYVLPTGGGKTVVLAAVMEALAARGKRCLFLVHRKELVEQTLAQLERRGQACGVIMARYAPRRSERIQVASTHTLARREGHDFGRFDLVIVDEAHHVVAKTYVELLARWPRAALLGATATPFRLDGLGLQPPFDALLAGPSVRELIAAGHLVEPRVLCDAAAVDTRGLRLDAQRIDWQPAALAKRAGAISGDVVRQFRASGGARRGIVYAVNVAHGESLTAEFNAAGVRAELIHGKTHPYARDDIMARVRAGATQLLVNVDIATEGFDVPEMEAVLMVRPTLSRCLYLQMIGRGLRAAPGKTDCLVLDHAGNVALHGLPTHDIPLSLAGLPKPERTPKQADGEAEEATRPGGRQPRFGDADAELQPLQRAALLDAASGAELLSADMVLRRGFRFAADAYDVAITAAPAGRPGAKACARCAGRAAFLPPPAWGPAWCAALGELCAVPGREAMARHVSSLVHANWRHVQATGKLRFSPQFVASRLLEQWGAPAAAELLPEGSSHPGAAALRKSKLGWQARACLAAALDGAAARAPLPPRPPPLRPAAAQLDVKHVRLVVQRVGGGGADDGTTMQGGGGGAASEAPG
jgi:DNA repair protein RadD